LIKTFSSKETQKIAVLLAREILKQKNPFFKKQALILLLSGDLGAGKTTFIQGFLRGLRVRKKITSPTFVLFKRFKIKDLRFKNIYHIDCYRIHELKDIQDIGIKEILNNPQNIVLIEWPERIKRILPKNAIIIKLKYGKKENERNIILGSRKQ